MAAEFQAARSFTESSEIRRRSSSSQHEEQEQWPAVQCHQSLVLASFSASVSCMRKLLHANRGWDGAPNIWETSCWHALGRQRTSQKLQSHCQLGVLRLLGTPIIRDSCKLAL